MKKVSIISLGCPKNLVDSETLIGQLLHSGYEISDNITGSDVVVINTCCFIKEAKEESIDTILQVLELKRNKQIKAVVVAGCLPQRYAKEIANDLKEVDIFIGIGGFEKLPFLLDSVLDVKIKQYIQIKKNPDILERIDAGRYLITPSHYAYIKISDGCNNKCTFCIIPKLRGRYKSRNINSIVEEVKSLAKDKRIKEVNIVGQDTTYYGKDLYSKPLIVDLLRSVANIKSIKWIRLLYTNPLYFSDDLIEFIASEKKMCKYIDIPLQHISDKVLKRMGRRINKQSIEYLIEKVRKRIPDLAIRTSFIVGFPGETEDEFQELVKFIKKFKFERLGVFTYSNEEGTPAYKLKKQINNRIKQERLDVLMSLQQQISKEINEGFLQKQIEVLVDDYDKSSDLYVCRSQYDAPEVDGQVLVRSKKKLKNGDLLKVKIIDTMEYDLLGEK